MTMPSLVSPYPGLNNVGSYLISGKIFLTGSNITGSGTNNGEVKISFPTVARSVTVVNVSSSALYVHFDSRNNPNVIGHSHYAALLNQADSWTFAAKCKEIYISAQSSAASYGSFALSAELTAVRIEDMQALSGSGIND